MQTCKRSHSHRHTLEIQKCRRHCMQIYDHAVGRHIFIDAIRILRKYCATCDWILRIFSLCARTQSHTPNVRKRNSIDNAILVAVRIGFEVLQMRIDLCTWILRFRTACKICGKWLHRRWHRFDFDATHVTNEMIEKCCRLCWCLISIEMDFRQNSIMWINEWQNARKMRLVTADVGN